MYAAKPCRLINTPRSDPGRYQEVTEIDSTDSQPDTQVNRNAHDQATIEEPPWEIHARELGVPAIPSSPKLRRMASPSTRRRSRSRTPATPPRPLGDNSPRVTRRSNPTAIRGWKSPEHLLEAIKLAGLPAPYELKEHVAGFLRYSGPTALVNYYTTTQTALVQGRMAGTWDERLRAARTLTLHC